MATNPPDKLGAHARTNGWPQLRFETRGLPSLENLTRTALATQAMIGTRFVGMLGKRLALAATATPIA